MLTKTLFRANSWGRAGVLLPVQPHTYVLGQCTLAGGSVARRLLPRGAKALGNIADFWAPLAKEGEERGRCWCMCMRRSLNQATQVVQPICGTLYPYWPQGVCPSSPYGGGGARFPAVLSVVGLGFATITSDVDRDNYLDIGVAMV